VRISDWEIDTIRAVADSGLPVEPYRYFRTGQWVKVRDGPLRGAIGKVVGSGRTRSFVVSINVLQRAVAVEVEENWLEPISTARSD
jgi:transcription antitermination factor NusG